MIAGLDSSFSRPTRDQALQARAAGVRIWSGYIATRLNVGLVSVWDRQSFENARLCGATPIAYCSGWDNPAALKALAAAWNVRLCVDVETGIRPDGPWVQGFLDASGAGLYGNGSVHWEFGGGQRRAAFHQVSFYPGFDPRATWFGGPRPSGPCGLQWAGGHPEFGADVDRAWFDDWFDEPAPIPKPQEVTMRVVTADPATDPPGYVDPHGQGAVYVTDGVVKRYISSPGQMADMLALAGQSTVTPINQGSLDRLPEVLPVDAPGSADLDYAALARMPAQLEAIRATIGQPAVVDVNALAAALGPHLVPAVDVAALAIDLAPHLPGVDPQAIAKAVADELKARLAS